METAPVAGYLERTFLPALGIVGRPLVVQPPPRSGTRSRVLILRVEGLGPLLMRAWESRATAARCVSALRHLSEVGLPAPRLIFQDLSFGARWIRAARGGPPYVTVESFIEGRRLSDLTDAAEREAALASTARLLRRFRHVTRRRWGRPDRPALRSYGAHVAALARSMLSRVRGAGWIEEPQRRDAERSLLAWAAAIDGRVDFCLVHKDINPDNLILTPTGEVIAVDLHRLAYEPFPEELLNALRHLAPGQPAVSARFLEAYFGDGADTDRGRFESTRGFFEPYYALKRLFRLVGRGPDHPGSSERPAWTEALLSARPPVL